MIRNTLTALTVALTLTACADSHDITTTDIDVNTTTTVSSAPDVSTPTYHGNLLWTDCDGYVTNMLAMHGTPDYSDHYTTSAAYEVLNVDYYFYVGANLRFEVIEYRDGSCETFTADYNA